jgi:hypothetical protein
LRDVSWLDRIGWAALGGYIVGVGLVIAAVANSDAGFLWAGVFVVVISVAGGRLKELAAGKEGFRALFFEDFAKEVAKQLPAPETAQLPAPTPAKREPKVIERYAEDHATASDKATVTLHPAAATGSGTPQAAAVIVRPQDVADARNEQELARRVIDYLQQSTGAAGRQLPALRGLSPHRIKAEQDLYGAILELQSDRHRSGDLGTQDAYERAIESEVVEWWNDPASLNDEEVVDLARRVRDLVDHRMKRGQ